MAIAVTAVVAIAIVLVVRSKREVAADQTALDASTATTAAAPGSAGLDEAPKAVSSAEADGIEPPARPPAKPRSRARPSVRRGGGQSEEEARSYR